MQNLQNNPCKNVTIPKGETKEQEFYSTEEISRLLTLLEDEQMKYQVFFNLAVFGGLRRSELCGLEWKDFDFDSGIMLVQRTLSYVPGEGLFINDTKTKKSRRYIKLPSHIIELLKQFKAEQEAERTTIGSKWHVSDRLFVTWEGKPMHNNTTYTWLKRFCERKNMRFCNIHSLRHFHCSLLINVGVDVATVSHQLGHSCQTTTGNIYIHQFQEAQARTSNIIANALDFTKKKKPLPT